MAYLTHSSDYIEAVARLSIEGDNRELRASVWAYHCNDLDAFTLWIGNAQCCIPATATREYIESEAHICLCLQRPNWWETHPLFIADTVLGNSDAYWNSPSNLKDKLLAAFKLFSYVIPDNVGIFLLSPGMRIIRAKVWISMAVDSLKEKTPNA